MAGSLILISSWKSGDLCRDQTLNWVIDTNSVVYYLMLKTKSFWVKLSGGKAVYGLSQGIKASLSDHQGLEKLPVCIYSPQKMKVAAPSSHRHSELLPMSNELVSRWRLPQPRTCRTGFSPHYISPQNSYKDNQHVKARFNTPSKLFSRPNTSNL